MARRAWRSSKRWAGVGGEGPSKAASTAERRLDGVAITLSSPPSPLSSLSPAGHLRLAVSLEERPPATGRDRRRKTGEKHKNE